MEQSGHVAGQSVPWWKNYELRLVFILSVAGGIAVLDAQALFFLMPFVAEEFALTNGQIGILGVAALLGWSVSGLISSLLSDRLGKRKPFLIGAFIALALLSGLSALAVGFITLFLARVCIGFSEGPVIPIKQTMVIAESDPKRRGLNMGIVHNFGGQLLGTLLGPLIMVAVATSFGWRGAFLVAGLPALIIAFVIWRFLREPSAEAVEATEDKPLPTDADNSTLKRLWRVLSNRNVFLCVLIAVPATAWYMIILTFVPVILVRELEYSPTQMSQLVAVIGLAGMLSAVIVPGLSDKFGRKGLTIVACILGAIAPLGIYFAGDNWLIVAGSLLFGCLMVGIFPLIVAIIPQENVAAEDRATASSLVLSVSQVGGALTGPMISGMVADRSGAMATLLLAVVWVVLAALISLFLKLPRDEQMAEIAPATH